MTLEGHMVLMGEIHAYKVSVVRLEMKMPHRPARCRWKKNVKMDLQYIICVRMWTGFIWLIIRFSGDLF
jgi:hypothetical protein